MIHFIYKKNSLEKVVIRKTLKFKKIDVKILKILIQHGTGNQYLLKSRRLPLYKLEWILHRFISETKLS